MTFPTKRVFAAVTLSIENGNRIGIVGRNGDGKSSLLRLLAGDLAPDAGEVTKKSNVTIDMLRQKDLLDPSASALSAATGNTQTHEWAAERKTREIVETLLAGIRHDALVKELSGGERRRVDLARVLIQDTDILLLDEPTNHLDMQTIYWLAEHLKQRWTEGSGALLVVTHDRWFIDEVCTSMWEVHDGRVSGFEGGYSAYILQRVERDRLLQLAEDKRQNLLRKELAWLARGARARATKPKFHVKIAHELIANEPPPRNTLELKRAAVARLGKQVIEFKNVSEVLGTKTIIKELDFLIGPGDRLAIMGANGTGKTTLLRLITGELSPTSGTVKIGKTVQLAYLSQQLEELEGLMQQRVLEVLKRNKSGYVIDGKHVSSTELLKRLGFEQAYFMARVQDLSGGQRRRLQLLLTLLKEPNVMILDEPGNDFDTDMLTVLEDLLDTWPGTLILVSHDRYLIERVTDMQYALIDGKLRHFPGGVDEYLVQVGRGSVEQRDGVGVVQRDGVGVVQRDGVGVVQRDGVGVPLFVPKSGTPTPSLCTTPTPSLCTTLERPGAPRQKQIAEVAECVTAPCTNPYETRKQLASTERKMRTVEKQIEEQAQALQATDPTDYLALGEAQDKLQELKEKLLELEADWLDLSEKLET
ncbi:MAG: ATP-binding cassette domain-containing protein [Coriobacteriia bacterium]|nr:ATP-binding cassette domain-containing protein [Coriobacteriia bacterium]